MKPTTNEKMQVTSKKYIVKYEGELEYISLNTLLVSQFHFAEALSEIKSELYPDQNLDIKVKALPKGSFQIEVLTNLSYIQHLLNSDVVEYAANLFTVLGSIAGIIAFLRAQKPKEVIDAGDNVIIVNGNNNQITVSKVVYKAYANNPKIEKEIIETIKPIQDDEEITGFVVLEPKSDYKVLSIPRDEFDLYQTQNELFTSQNRSKRLLAEQLIVYKVVFGAGPKWQFYTLSGHKIPASMGDKEFLQRLDKERFGKGDVLVCDVDIDEEFDESLGIYVPKSYKITKVREHKIKADSSQGTLFKGDIEEN